MLSSASGALRPGELVAVLGASGSGKTTLLSALARRVPLAAGRVSLLHASTGAGAGSGAADAAAFIAQDDLFLVNLTVREHLCFQARLRLPHLSRTAAEARADALLARLGLAKCAGSLIGAAAEGGAAARGVSGGERKRLSIASALLSSPSLVLADEPTSGLDSFTAEKVVRMLRALADDGRAVIVTIHQPSSHVLELFDRVLLLADGFVAFDGTTAAALDHFAALGCPCPPRHNPADHFIRALALVQEDGGARGGDLDGGPEGAMRHNATARRLAVAWASAAAADSAKAAAAVAAVGSLQTASDSGDGARAGRPRSSAFAQFSILLERNAISMSRDPVLFYTRCAQTAIVSLLAGSVFFRLGSAQTQVMDRSGAVFFCLLNQALAAIIGVLQTFPVEREVVQREHASGAYGITPYFIAKNVSSLPFEMLFPTVFSSVCFFMMRLRIELDTIPLVFAWLKFTGTCVLASSVATSMGLWISTAAPTVAVALALAPVVLMPFMLFSGFLVNIKTVAPAFSPLVFTSLFKYAFSALMTVVWRDVKNDCEGAFICPFPTGESVLSWFSLDGASVTSDVAALGALLLAWRLLAYLTLLWRSRR